MADTAYLGWTSPPRIRSLRESVDCQSGSSNSGDVAFSNKRSNVDVVDRNIVDGTEVRG